MRIAGRLIAVLLLGALCGQAAFGRDLLRREAVRFDRAEVPIAAQLDKARAAGTLAGAAGRVEFDFEVPAEGWYAVSALGNGSQVHARILRRGAQPAEFIVYGSNPAHEGRARFGNAWLQPGAHVLVLEHYYWTGFPDLRGVEVRASDGTLEQSVQANLATPAIFREDECPPLEIRTGRLASPARLRAAVWDTVSSRTLTTLEVPLKAGEPPATQRLALPCRPGHYAVGFLDGERRIATHLLRDLHYEVHPRRTAATAEVRTLLESIEAAERAPDHTGVASRVVAGAGGRYRESGDLDWFRYQQLPQAVRALSPPPGWFAYTLKSVRAGGQYEVEVEFPDDTERAFAIALRESAPLSYPLALGVETGGEFRLSGVMQRQVLRFRARTDAPRLLVVNARPGARAALAAIRVYSLAGAGEPLAPAGEDRREFVNWYEEGSNITAMFGAPDTAARGQRLAFERWADDAVGQGVSLLMPTAVVYSFGLFPSRHNRAFSRPDEGALARLLRVAQARGLGVVPELHPRAEELSYRYATAPDSKPNLLVSGDGATAKSLPPLFNPLHPGNRHWHDGLVTELVERYGGHPAFRGVSLRLMQWANPALVNFHSLDWGYDDHTIEAYRKATGSAVPAGAAGDPRRHAARHAWLLANERERWLRWRAERITAIVAELAKMLRARRADLRLFLTAFDAYPSGHGAGWLREAGIDPEALARIDGVVLVNALHAYGRRYDEVSSQGTRDNLLDPRVLRALAPRGRAAFLSYTRYMEATEVVVPPEDLGFPPSTPRTWMSAVFNPAGRHALERYAVPLAETDALLLGDGGNGYTLGQPVLREFMREFRRLPALPFESRADAIDPVAVRTRAGKDALLLYAVNREAYPVRVILEFEGAKRLARLAGGDPVPLEAGRATLDLLPYQLIAFTADATARLASVRLEVPEAERRAVAALIERTALEHHTLIAAYRRLGCLPAGLRHGVERRDCGGG